MNSNNFISKKTAGNCSILLLLIFYFSGNIEAQSVIYKKDRTQIKVERLDEKGKIRSYKLLNETDTIKRFISRNAMDSIRYEDGRVEHFFSHIILPETKEETQKTKKNFIGLNIWPLFTPGLDFFYERFILKDNLGFKNHIYINTNSGFHPYEGIYRRANYFLSTGFNYYFLQSDMFRFGTGLSFLTGQFDYENWEYYNNYEYDRDYQEKNWHSGLSVNVSYSYIWQKQIYTSIEFDLPLWQKEPNNILIFKTEIAFNF